MFPFVVVCLNKHIISQQLGNDEALGLVIESERDQVKLLEVIADIDSNRN